MLPAAFFHSLRQMNLGIVILGNVCAVRKDVQCIEADLTDLSVFSAETY